jgi:hypothetical protein
MQRVRGVARRATARLGLPSSSFPEAPHDFPRAPLERLVTCAVGSTVLVVAIVAVWVVVLLPMFLRGHDRRTELQSADRFAGAMRVLSRRRGRRGGLVDRRFELMPSQQRAEVISRAFGVPPTRAEHLDRALGAVPPSTTVRRVSGPTSERRAARVAARRRGFAVLVAAIALTLLLAVAVGGPLWAVFGLTLVLSLAGLAQLRAAAIADRFTAAPRTSSRSVPRVADSPVSVPATRSEPAAAQAFSAAVGHDVVAPVVRGAGKQIVFDAVPETPVVERPRVRKVAAPAARRQVTYGVPDDFYERPLSPPAPEHVRREYVPLLDEVDTDPETLTSGLEALDSILGRASGE